MNESLKLEIGDHVVWRGQGLARIDRIQTDGEEATLHLVLGHSGMRIALPAANAERALRRPVDHDSASRIWNDLKQPVEVDLRAWDDRYFDYMRTLVKGTPQDQALRLRGMYSSRFKPTFGELRLIAVYEEVLFSELGHVLGRSIGELRTETKSLHAGFSPDAAERPPEPKRPAPATEGPALRGFALLGSFEVEGGLVVADPSHVSSHADLRSGLSHRIAATPGRWYGYAATNEETARTGTLVAVHASRIPTKPSSEKESPLSELRKKAAVVAQVRVEGGQIAILDQAIRDDERFEDELFFRTRFGTVLNRGCTSDSGLGDGVYPVSVLLERGQAIYVHVDFT